MSLMFRNEILHMSIAPCPSGIKAAPKTPPIVAWLSACARRVRSVKTHQQYLRCEPTVSVARRDVNQSLRNVCAVDGVSQR